MAKSIGQISAGAVLLSSTLDRRRTLLMVKLTALIALMAIPASRAWADSLACGIGHVTYGSAAIGNATVTPSTGIVKINRHGVSSVLGDGACLRGAGGVGSTSDSSDGASEASAGSITTSIGHLGASASASALQPSWATVHASSFGSGLFYDTFIPTSLVDPLGSAVNFSITLGVTYAVAGNGVGLVAADMGVAPGLLSDGNPGVAYVSLSGDGSALSPVSQTVTLYVGSIYSLTGSLLASARAGSTFGLDSNVDVNAAHSASFALRSADPNVSFVTASGCSLDGTACVARAATPEPSSLLLLSSGMAGALLLAGARKIAPSLRA